MDDLTQAAAGWGCQQIIARDPGSFTPAYWPETQAEQGDRDCGRGQEERAAGLRRIPAREEPLFVALAAAC